MPFRYARRLLRPPPQDTTPRRTARRPQCATPAAVRTVLALLALAATAALPATARGQVALSGGVDGGLTFPTAGIARIDPSVDRRDPFPTVALGVDVAGYYLLPKNVALGFVLAPSFFAAGPEPSTGINFALGPRFVWRPAPLHVALDAGLVVSAFDDQCDGVQGVLPEGCPRTRTSEGSAPGFGAAFAPLYRMWHLEKADVLFGPAMRYQVARYDYVDGGGDGYLLHAVQIVLAVRAFVDLGPPSP